MLNTTSLKHLYKYSLLLLTLVLMSGGCKKNKKQPIEVDMAVAMNPVFNGAGDLNFWEGTILIDKIRVEAVRESGDPVNYVRSFEDIGGLSAKMDGIAALEQLKFDFPAGNYTSVEVYLEVDGESMELRGTYNPPNSSNIYNIQFLLDEEFTFELELTNELEMKPDNQSQFVLELNPLAWFRVVVAQAFISASIYSVDNQPTVVISSNKNTAIYNRVRRSLDKENRLLFQ